MKLRNAIFVLIALVLANGLARHFVVRWDLTDDKRYSISHSTQLLLAELEYPLEVTILLDGELNSGFKRLKKATIEMVEELGIYANHGVQFLPINTSDLQGLEPTIIHERTHKGQTAQTTIYPFAIVKYGVKKTTLTLLKNQRGLSGEENLNHSIENLEYAFIEAIRRLTQTTAEKVAFLEGHGELEEQYVYDLTQALARYYQVDRGTLGTISGVLDDYKAVIIADPQSAFRETDKYILDQYIMQGGRVLWAVNGIRFSQDFLATQGNTPVIALDLNINDMLFRYGTRINHVLVQDLQCLPVPIDVSTNAEQPNWQPMPWTYAPLLLTSQQSPITRNVAQIAATMASTIDIVGGEDGIQKEILLATSSASKLTRVPAEINLSFGVNDEKSFLYAHIPVAISLEGEFTSLYAHLPPPDSIKQHAPLLKKSKLTRQVIIAAGSIVRNEWLQGRPLPLGYDRYTQTQFGNRDFLINAVLYLTDDEGWLKLRQKEITLRLINDQRARLSRITAQIISIVFPLIILGLTCGLVLMVRQKKYANNHKE